MVRRFCVAAVSLIALASCSAAGDVSVAVTTVRPNTFRIAVHTEIQAPRSAVWRVITDYNHHADFLPYMARSVELSRRNAAVDVLQEIRFHIVFWPFTLRARLHITEDPDHHMHFASVGGDYRRLEGDWTLGTAPTQSETTDVRCEFLVEPKRSAPEWIVRLAAKRYLAAMVKRLRERVEETSR
ncbi:MAG TPA: SRPBCC family protein [Elusimicrobiota bacterium]|nr:SRPBCC family protein [Elusimicrobiota bacterium]